METNKEVVALKGQIIKIETQANAITIESQDDYKSAIDIVSKLKETGSKIKKTKESITKPLNESLKNARALFKPVEDQYKSAEMIIKGKLLDYQREINRKAAEREAKIAARVEKGTMKLETAEKKIDEVERVDQTTRGDVGQVQIRKIKKVIVNDEKLLPREYLVPDMIAIRRDALGGTNIPGVEVYEEESIAAR